MRIRKCQEPVTNAVIITLCRGVKKENTTIELRSPVDIFLTSGLKQQNAF